MIAEILFNAMLYAIFAVLIGNGLLLAVILANVPRSLRLRMEAEYLRRHAELLKAEVAKLMLTQGTIYPEPKNEEPLCEPVEVTDPSAATPGG
jgi:hypothetical protein